MSASGLPRTAAVLGPDGLQALIAALAARGMDVIGPVERDGAIVLDHIAGLADLPAGRTDRQEAGFYRLADRDGRRPVRLCRRAAIPGSASCTVRSRRCSASAAIGDELAFDPPRETPPRTAFLGVRACELAAIAIQDRVFQGGAYVNTEYAARRAQTFLVAVNCGDPAATCFCTSHDTGPRARAGYDIALTELLDAAGTNSSPSRAAIPAPPCSPTCPPARRPRPTGGRRRRWRTARRRTCGGACPTEGLKAALQSHPEHPRWDEVARALPGLRQLHHGLPHLLLHHRGGSQRPRRPRRGARAAAGIPASPAISPMSMAAPCAPRRGRATASG